MTGSTPHLVLLFLAFSLFHTIHLLTDHVATKCRLRQSNVFYDTYQSWTSQARSVTECATRCGQQEECISFIFWNAGSEKWRSCIGYTAEASILSGGTISDAPGALLYDMDGRKAIYCGVTPTVLYADPSRYDGILGDLVTYECSAGYNQIRGDNGQRVCNASGTWLLLTGKTDPLCNEIICGPPPTVTNALSFKNKQYSFGDEVVYTCKKDKVNIAGANATGRRQCNQTGYWNQVASDPVCV